jgi:hypothetical protein
MSNFTYKSGDRIRYTVMEVGATYMIKPDISCYSEEYPFELMPCLESMMEVIIETVNV